jgi:hypothetical protein
MVSAWMVDGRHPGGPGRIVDRADGERPSADGPDLAAGAAIHGPQQLVLGRPQVKRQGSRIPFRVSDRLESTRQQLPVQALTGTGIG